MRCIITKEFMCMKQVCWSLAVTLGLIVTFASIPGCTNSSPSSLKTVRCCLMGNPKTVDPRTAIGYRQQPFIAKMFEGLMCTGEDGTPKPALAKTILISEDKKTYTFILRPSTWSDGSPVTAYDFAYAWKSVISKQVQSMLASAFFDIKNARKAFHNMCTIDEVGIHVLDDLELQVELEHPAPYFLEWVANPIYSPICRSCLKGRVVMDELQEKEFVCNGPYRLVKKMLTEQIGLKKNPYYRNPSKADHEEIQFIVLNDPNTAYNLFSKGELDWIGDPLGGAIPLEVTDCSILKNASINPKKVILERISCNVYFKPLSSVKIRQAFARAINRAELVSAFSQNRKSPSFSILPQKDSLLGRKPFEDYDIPGAQKLFLEGLDELGFTLETYPPLTISACCAEPSTRILCELVAQQLHKAFGITVTVRSMELRQQFVEVVQNHFELGYNTWLSYLNDPIYNIDSFNALGGGFFKNGWKNQAYTDLVRESNEECDPQKRKELLKAAEALVLEEMPILPLVENPFFYAKSTKIDSHFFDF